MTTQARPTPLPAHYILPRLAAAINTAYFGGRLPRVTVAYANLPPDRHAQYRHDLHEILIDPRAPDPTSSLIHELCHVATAGEKDIHGRRFQEELARLRQKLPPSPARVKPPARPAAGPVVDDRREFFRRLREGLQLIQDQYKGRARQRGATAMPRRERETPMPEQLWISRTVGAREYRKPGAPSVEAQIRLIRQWQAAHPSLCGIPNQRFQVIGGRVIPSYADAPRPLSVDEKARRMRQRAAAW